MARLLLAAGLAAGAAVPAAAADWKFVGRDADGVRYLDADSVSRKGEVVAFWMLKVRGPVTAGADMTELLGSAHCTDHSYKLIEERINPESSLRRPTWIVKVRKAWRQFDAVDRLETGDPLREIIDMACGAREIGPVTLAERPEPKPDPAVTAQAVPSAPAAAAIILRPGGGIGTVHWVSLGAAATGQAIMVDASSLAEEGAQPQGWFRLINPGAPGPMAVSYLLRIDCGARTINQLGLRRHDAAGGVSEQVDYGVGGEGAVAIEKGTVMEVVHYGLCTGEGVGGLRRAAGAAPAKPVQQRTSPAPASPPPTE